MPLALSARGEDVHRDRVAGQGEHADAGHGHAIGDEQRRVPAYRGRKKRMAVAMTITMATVLS